MYHETSDTFRCNRCSEPQLQRDQFGELGARWLPFTRRQTRVALASGAQRYFGLLSAGEPRNETVKLRGIAYLGNQKQHQAALVVKHLGILTIIDHPMVGSLCIPMYQ